MRASIIFIKLKNEIDLSKYKEITIVNQERCISFSDPKEYIQLKAQRDGTHVILFYRFGQNSINFQYFELKIPENIQISTCYETLLLTDKQNQFTKRYQLQAIPVNLINRGIDLFGRINQLNFTYQKDGLTIHCFDLGQSWYSGQAFQIDLKNPIEDLQYMKTLIKQTETIQFSQSIMEYASNNLVQLMENKIVLVSKANLKTTEFPLDNQYKFTIILYIYDDLIYVKAQKDNQDNIFFVTKCKDYNCQLQSGCNQLNNRGKILYLNKLHFFYGRQSVRFDQHLQYKRRSIKHIGIQVY
ncbi:unnamed protein product [Paramecium sonneborni]|uniref:Uncharacterized protein n=1 Tax=Paramecium sonneborni TaxID=65129 RepID=A0A8S1L7U7_9CILI|nr:unnamed protein product [Paramecium sonneborni]